jgi:hypothetical protein
MEALLPVSGSREKTAPARRRRILLVHQMSNLAFLIAQYVVMDKG